MFTEADEQEFQRLLAKFKEDKKLFEHLQTVGFEDFFSYEFLALHSDFSSLDDILFRSGFGIMSPMEIEKIPAERWDAYIAKHNGKCSTWREFGKLAMTAWMKNILQSGG
ncbi:MAG: hypothetical protein LBP78_03115 [Acidaminococcales bacterium]|jgi:hypothetical protein|nr:hypothetical protein [Acidaminococcales bacterium]